MIKEEQCSNPKQTTKRKISHNIQRQIESAEQLSYGQGSRFAGACGEGEGTDAQGGQAGQEEEAPRPRPQAHAVQSPLRHRRCWIRQETGTQLIGEVKHESQGAS